MKKISIIVLALVFAAVMLLGASFSNVALAVANPQVSTNAATSVQGGTTVLNGYLYDLGGYSSANVWFQWGTSTSYGNTTNSVAQYSGGVFTQQLFSLTPNQTYHYRAVAQNSYGIAYGQDMYFTANGTSNNGLLLVTKTGRNLSVGNMTWSFVTNAAPADIIQFKITVSVSGSQSINNVIVRDTLPNNLIFNNNMTLDGAANSGNIISGLNIGSVAAGQTRTITYQAQVAPLQNFTADSTTLTNSVTASSSDSGVTSAVASTSVVVARLGIAGASAVSTGLTNNFLVDSFFLPLLIALVGIWLYRSGFIRVPRWVGSAQLKNKEHMARRQLESKISQVKRNESSGS